VEVVDRRTVRVLLTIGLFATLVALLYFALEALLVFLFTFFFAYLLEPLVKVVQPGVRGSRMAAIGIAYAAVALLCWGLFALVGPNVRKETSKITQAGPALMQQVQSGEIANRLGSQAGWSGHIQGRMREWMNNNRERLSGWSRSLAAYAASLGAVIFWSIVIPILAIWVLRDKDQWIRSLAETPESISDKRRLRDTLHEIDRAMARYIWAQLLLSLFALIAFAAFLYLMKVPHALLLATAAAVLELIFVFGPLAAGVLVMGVAVFTGQQNWLPILIFLIAWRIVQDYVNTPLLFGERLEMHPLWVVFVLVIGWEMGGVIGMFIAVPIAAAVQIVWEAWSHHGHPGKNIKQLFEEPRAA
jgi:predicted PurR-regulated permease PerM